MTISDLMKMEESSPNGLKTLLEKEKFAHYEQFLIFQQCFQKYYMLYTCSITSKNQGLFGKRLTEIFMGLKN